MLLCSLLLLLSPLCWLRFLMSVLSTFAAVLLTVGMAVAVGVGTPVREHSWVVQHMLHIGDPTTLPQTDAAPHMCQASIIRCEDCSTPKTLLAFHPCRDISGTRSPPAVRPAHVNSLALICCKGAITHVTHKWGADLLLLHGLCCCPRCRRLGLWWLSFCLPVRPRHHVAQRAPVELRHDLHPVSTEGSSPVRLPPQ